MSKVKETTYCVEYAKTSRGACKVCGKPIKQDTLRVGRQVPSRFHDGKDTSWNHLKCIQPQLEAYNFTDIHGWEYLRWDDQEALRDAALDNTETIDPEIVALRKQRNERLWAAKDRLVAVNN